MNKRERAFIDTVWEYFERAGRHELPWRRQSHLKPYNILVSELMLQQTQVARVVPKYLDFVKRWANAKRLATASLGDVLRAWQGLGYNRRAKFLQTAAAEVVAAKNSFPMTYEELLTLPGVGPYTAAAVMNFAYNRPQPMIETNIRTVYIHHFFMNKSQVDDRDISRLTARLLDQERPREWHWALMDYGAYLKQTFGNQNPKSKHYTKQSCFKGSDREIRGAILRQLSLSPMKKIELHSMLFETVRIDEQIKRLLTEGLIVEKRSQFWLP